LLQDATFIVNTTSLGMEGKDDLTFDLSSANANALLTDIVYVPLETPLLKAARAHGLRTVDGLGMLLHQAVPGFKHWFGATPEVTPELRALILADMDRPTHGGKPT
jgi:shikimate dehydrogenase